MSDCFFDFINQFNCELTQSNSDISLTTPSVSTNTTLIPAPENCDCKITPTIEPTASTSNYTEIDSFLDTLKTDFDNTAPTVINPFKLTKPSHKNLKRTLEEKTQVSLAVPLKQKKPTKVQPKYLQTDELISNTPNLKNTFNIIIPTSTSDHSTFTYTQPSLDKTPTFIGGKVTFSTIPSFLIEQSNIGIPQTPQTTSQHTTKSTPSLDNTNILTTAIKISEIEELPQLPPSLDAASQKPPVNVTQLPHVNIFFVFY